MSISSEDTGRAVLAILAVRENIALIRAWALAHTYDDTLDERVILTIREDLPALDARLAEIMESLEGSARK